MLFPRDVFNEHQQPGVTTIYSFLKSNLHSEQYKRIDSTIAQKILVFSLVESLDVQILWRLLLEDHAIPFLALKSFSEDEVEEPRYL